VCVQDVEVRLEVFRVNHVAATNATIYDQQADRIKERFDDAPYHRAQSGRVAGFETHRAARNRAAHNRDDQQHDESDEREEYAETYHFGRSHVLILGTTVKS